LFKHLFDGELLTEKALDNDKMVSLTFDIDAVAEYSINPAEIENAIHVKWLPILFTELGLDNAQKLMRIGDQSHDNTQLRNKQRAWCFYLW